MRTVSRILLNCQQLYVIGGQRKQRVNLRKKPREEVISGSEETASMNSTIQDEQCLLAFTFVLQCASTVVKTATSCQSFNLTDKLDIPSLDLTTTDMQEVVRS
jgi:hypothetical protein